MPQLQVDRLNGFLALVPAEAGTAVNTVAAQFVTGLDALRAPIEAAERARRLSSGLSPRQQELMDQWGYPYVLDEFRFHMTISERMDPTRAERLQPWIEEWFAPALADPPGDADVGVFVQLEAGCRICVAPALQVEVLEFANAACRSCAGPAPGNTVRLSTFPVAFSRTASPMT